MFFAYFVVVEAGHFGKRFAKNKKCHFSKKNEKRPRIYADLITNRIFSGTFVEILRKVVCFFLLRISSVTRLRRLGIKNYQPTKKNCEAIFLFYFVYNVSRLSRHGFRPCLSYYPWWLLSPTTDDYFQLPLMITFRFRSRSRSTYVRMYECIHSYIHTFIHSFP